MKLSIPATLLLVVASMSAQLLAAQSPNTPSEIPKLARLQERDSYDVYSDLLRATKPDIATWTIIQETKDFTFCLKPAQNLDPSHRQVIDDYALKNQKQFILERMFTFPNTRWHPLNVGSTEARPRCLPSCLPLVSAWPDTFWRLLYGWNRRW